MLCDRMQGVDIVFALYRKNYHHSSSYLLPKMNCKICENM